jgi:nitrite reductase/ring-hydroxylating ferredoxin subunit
LRDLPRKEKLLSEEIVVFRNRKGRVGAIDPHCVHRGTSLEWGRVEEEGLRCCYHGWLYDTQGRCIDMPYETEEFRQAMASGSPLHHSQTAIPMASTTAARVTNLYDLMDSAYDVRRSERTVARSATFRLLTSTRDRHPA